MTMEKSEAISIQTSDRNFRNYSEKPLKNTSIAKNTKFLVGSLYSEKPPNAYALMDVMKRAWRASGGIDMREWSNNLFMVRFEEEKKMRWVIENQPWHFENSLFLIRQLEPMEQPSKILLREAQIWVRFYDAPLSFMTEGMAEQIAGKVGRFIRVDSSHDLFGRYMRVKVGINVSKKLVNRINVKVEGIDFEIGIKYEALPTYCYYCGTIGHTFKYCEMMNHDVEEDPENFPFGPAIKASPSKRAKSSISPTFQVKDQRPKPKQSILQTPSENKESISFVVKEQGNPIEIGKDWKRIPVHFRALERPKEDEFCLELAKNHTYDDVVDRVAQKLGLDDPSKIRLTPHNCYSQQPKPNPIKYRSVDHLLDMLVHYNQISDILYYEILDIPLPELQCLKTLKVAFHHATKDEGAILNIRLLKQSTVGDVLNEIKKKVELSHPDAELRLLEVFYHKIYKIFPIHEKIENINDQYWTLRAEEIPEEEKNLGPNDRLIHVYHFTKEIAQNQVQVQNFGDPFFLVIHEGESLADVKLRIQKKLQVPDEEFFKWKFAFLSLGRPEYLEDSDIISSHFQRRDVYGAWEQYLGLEHSGSTPKRAYTVNQNRHTFEKPVKIYN